MTQSDTSALSPTGGRQLSIRIVMLPKDTNGHGTIFGGAILSHLDLAGSVAAQTYRPHQYVTVAMREVEFIAPVHVGDLVNFYTQVKSVGRTSITIDVEVEVQRKDEPGERLRVTEAEIVYVAVGPDRKPIPIDSAP